MTKEELLELIDRAARDDVPELDLYDYQLTELPAEIGKLTNLQTLVLRDNRLTELPAEIGELTNLQTLDLRFNRLVEIPPEIGQLTDLRKLFLAMNQFTKLPPDIGNLTNLQTLDLRENPLQDMPPEILAKVDEPSVILDYYFAHIQARPPQPNQHPSVAQAPVTEDSDKRPARAEDDAAAKSVSVFVSYSHDSPEHKAWVLQLASDLRKNGLDVLLDQWELWAGKDVTFFMDRIAEVDKVVCICTDTYVRKAEAGQGGVGYERQIVTAQIVRDLHTDKFIPIVRNANREKPMPSFLGPRIYLDFSDDQDYEHALEDLLRVLYRVPRHPKPDLGKRPTFS